MKKPGSFLVVEKRYFINFLEEIKLPQDLLPKNYAIVNFNQQNVLIIELTLE